MFLILVSLQEVSSKISFNARFRWLCFVSTVFLSGFWLTGEILPYVCPEYPRPYRLLFYSLWLCGNAVALLLMNLSWSQRKTAGLVLSSLLLIMGNFHTSEYHLVFQATNVSQGESFSRVARCFASQDVIFQEPQKFISYMPKGADQGDSNWVNISFEKGRVSGVRVVHD